MRYIIILLLPLLLSCGRLNYPPAKTFREEVKDTGEKGLSIKPIKMLPFEALEAESRVHIERLSIGGESIVQHDQSATNERSLPLEAGSIVPIERLIIVGGSIVQPDQSTNEWSLPLEAGSIVHIDTIPSVFSKFTFFEFGEKGQVAVLTWIDTILFYHGNILFPFQGTNQNGKGSLCIIALNKQRSSAEIICTDSDNILLARYPTAAEQKSITDNPDKFGIMDQYFSVLTSKVFRWGAQ